VYKTFYEFVGLHVSQSWKQPKDLHPRALIKSGFPEFFNHDANECNRRCSVVVPTNWLEKLPILALSGEDLRLLENATTVGLVQSFCQTIT